MAQAFLPAVPPTFLSAARRDAKMQRSVQSGGEKFAVGSIDGCNLPVMVTEEPFPVLEQIPDDHDVDN